MKELHGNTRREGKKKQGDTPFTEGFAPPDEHHNTDAQIKSGETRHSLKIPTVSDESLPRALPVFPP